MTKPKYQYKFLKSITAWDRKWHGPDHLNDVPEIDFDGIIAKSDYGMQFWKLNEWHSVKGEVRKCRNGFHSSARIEDAYSYVQGDILALVQVRGKDVVPNEWESGFMHDKSCHRSMKIARAFKITPALWDKLNAVVAEKIGDDPDEFSVSAWLLLDYLRDEASFDTAAWLIENAEEIF